MQTKKCLDSLNYIMVKTLSERKSSVSFIQLYQDHCFPFIKYHIRFMLYKGRQFYLPINNVTSLQSEYLKYDRTEIAKTKSMKMDHIQNK